MRDTVNMSRVFPLQTVGEEPYMLSNRISEYLNRSLTFDRDILAAFRGVLAAYERHFPTSSRIVAGLAIGEQPGMSNLETLASGLSWCFEPSSGLERRPDFPSWTWLGWNVPAFTSFKGVGCRDAALVDASVEYADGVPSWNANQI
jgi:hypothetical protein